MSRIELTTPTCWLRALSEESARWWVNERWIGTSARHDGWTATGRRTDEHWWLLVLEGRCTVRVGGRRLVAEPGQMLWVVPRATYDVAWSPTLRFAEVYVGVRRGRSLLTPLARSVVVNETGETVRSMQDLADEVQGGGAFSRERRHALLVALAGSILRLHATGDEPVVGLSRARRAAMRAYVNQRLGEPITPTALARALGLSPAYFSRVFRATYGVSPRVWLTRHRLEQAAGLLARSDLSVGEVAARVGYAGPAQFSRQFKRVLGVAPSEHRRR